jgi:hypothetical protein
MKSKISRWRRVSAAESWRRVAAERLSSGISGILSFDHPIIQ